MSSYAEKLTKKLLAIRKKIKKDVLSVFTASKGDAVPNEVGNGSARGEGSQHGHDAFPGMASSELVSKADDTEDTENDDDDSADSETNGKKKKDDWWILPLGVGLYILLRRRILAIAILSYAQALEEYGLLLSSEVWEKTRDHLGLDVGTEPGEVPEKAPAVIDEETIAGASDLSESVVNRDIAKLVTLLDQAYREGMSPKETKKLLADAFDEGITSVSDDGSKRTINPDSFFETVSRSELHGTAVQTQLHLFRSALIYRTVIWIGLQPCDICLDLEGTIWELDDPKMPIPPIHCNCRCGLVPTTISA